MNKKNDHQIIECVCGDHRRKIVNEQAEWQGSNDIERSLRVNASHHFVVCKYTSALMCAPSSKCLSSLLS